MANTAEIFNFPVPDAAQKEPRVADLDDGYTRIANELLEAVMLAGLTQHQLLVFRSLPDVAQDVALFRINLHSLMVPICALSHCSRLAPS